MFKETGKASAGSIIQLLRLGERLILFVLMLLALLSVSATAMWHGFISQDVMLRSLAIGIISAALSFYLVQAGIFPRRLLSGIVLFYAFALLLIDIRKEIGVPIIHLFMFPSKALIFVSAQEALSFLMTFMLTLAALKHLQLLDPIDFSLVLLVEFSAYVLMLPLCRTLSFVLFFIPYGVVAVAALLLLQSAHMRFIAPTIETQRWESTFRGSFLRTVFSLSGWVLMLAVILSYALTSFVQPTNLLVHLSKIELKISERLSKYLMKAPNVLSFYGFSLSLRHPATELSGTVVMRVKCDVPGYWRLCAYDYYKDGTWRRQLKWHMEHLKKGEELIIGETDDQFGEFIKTEDVRQTVYVERCTLTYLPVLFEPTKVDADLEWMGFDSAGAIRSRRLIGQGFSYEAWSKVKLFSAHKVSWVELNANDIKRLSRYLQLPKEIKPKLTSIARRITAGANTTWDKAQAIRRYLKRGYTYDESAPPAPYDQEPVIYFLTISGRGVCTHFASAMVLLCRAIGIPARLAAGFAIGEWDDAKRSFIVRERDAHAWAEVYIPPVGWVAMEATPGYSIPPPRRLTMLVDQEGVDWFSGVKEWLFMLWEQYDVYISIGLILIASFAFCIFVLMHTPIKIPKWRERSVIRGEVAELFRRAVRIISKRHRQRKIGETAIEYAMSTKGILPEEGHSAFMQMAELFTQAVYGAGVTYDTSRISQMRALLTELNRALRGMRDDRKMAG